MCSCWTPWGPEPPPCGPTPLWQNGCGKWFHGRRIDNPNTHGADGTLDEACFKGYIVDDSLYLREYPKVFAWGILHSRDMEEIRNYYSLLSFVNEAEDSTRRYYLKRYHLKNEAIQPLPLRPQNQAYVDYMLRTAQNADDTADCMMACMPCMLSYG